MYTLYKKTSVLKSKKLAGEAGVYVRPSGYIVVSKEIYGYDLNHYELYISEDSSKIAFKFLKSKTPNSRTFSDETNYYSSNLSRVFTIINYVLPLNSTSLSANFKDNTLEINLYTEKDAP